MEKALDLQSANGTNKGNLMPKETSATTSPFVSAQPLKSLDNIPYPEGVHGTERALNEVSTPVGFRYDRDFLLQFKEVCKGKPPHLNTYGLIDPLDPAALSRLRLGSRRKPAVLVQHPTEPGANPVSQSDSQNRDHGHTGKPGVSEISLKTSGAAPKKKKKPKKIRDQIDPNKPLQPASAVQPVKGIKGVAHKPKVNASIATSSTSMSTASGPGVSSGSQAAAPKRVQKSNRIAQLRSATSYPLTLRYDKDAGIFYSTQWADERELPGGLYDDF